MSAARLLALSASPVFAIMTLLSYVYARHPAYCSGVGGFDGMTVMYGLMSLFHAPPWLNLRRGRRAIDQEAGLVA
ncbi:MAG: hypothetical protein JSS55_03380 [Proteobacteria bacterium]|nr:hypothetical protein [Pseudomonadota bacterium]